MRAKQHRSGVSGAQGWQAAVQDSEESRLSGSLTLMDRDEAIAEQWDELCKSFLVGHTNLQDLWIHLLPFLLSLPLFLFLFFFFFVL